MKFGAVVIISISSIITAACAGRVSPETTQDMPIGYLCRILDSGEYISTPI